MLRRDFVQIVAGGGAAVAASQLSGFGQTRLPLSDVVVLLPGIMGSVLAKDGRDIWALSGDSIISGIRTLGGSISSLTLKGDSPDADDLGDGVTATRLIPDTHLIPGFWKIDGYTHISDFITQQFDAQRGRNFFEFPYDWRRDNRVAARKLSRATRGWLDAWRRTSGNANAGLILVAHSMGGLVARHFLEVLGGWKDTRMLVTFGTPYRGSVNALDFLANGIKKSVGPLTLVDMSALIRSFTSAYQLLPIYRCYDSGGGDLVRVGETQDIPNVNAARAKAALAFHNDILSAVTKNAKNPTYIAKRYSLHPVVGNYQPTFQSGRRVGNGVQMSLSLGTDQSLRGDGTVPEASARPIETPELEKAHRSVYVAEVHGSLQNSDPVLTHLGGLFREGALNTSAFRDSRLNVALMLDDIYTTTEPLTIRAQCEEPDEPLVARVVRVSDGAEIARAPLQRKDSAGEVNLGPFGEGVYRVQVSGSARAGSASDVCLVVRT
jgi:hypothetical protein